jgi:glycosyltransferase involved in cell wall biosynthesis
VNAPSTRSEQHSVDAPATATDRPQQLETLTVSIVIPTYNRLSRLERVLSAVADQTYPRSRYEVVVVSDGSTDGTDDYLRSRAQRDLVVVAQANAGPAAARNRGVAAAGGELVIFIDDDVVAAPELVQEHVDSHRRGGDGLIVIGPMLTPPDVALSPWVRWEQTMLYRQYDAMLQGRYAPTPRQFFTGNASLARSAVLAAGGFDTRFRRAEDIELAYRLATTGMRFSFNPNAIGHHYADRSFGSWLRNAAEYGAADVILSRDHGHHEVGQIVREGFQCRPLPVRRMTMACLSHHGVEFAMRNVYRGVLQASRALHADRFTQLALSGLYNLAYYRGVADELGGPSEFRQLVEPPGGPS